MGLPYSYKPDTYNPYKRTAKHDKLILDPPLLWPNINPYTLSPKMYFLALTNAPLTYDADVIIRKCHELKILN